MNKKTRLMYGFLNAINVLICAAVILHKFNIPVVNNITGSLALILFIVNTAVVYNFIRKYKYPLRTRIFVNGYFVYSLIAFLIQFIFNFIGYTEVSQRPQIIENIILFSFIGIFIYASTILYSITYWTNPLIQETHGVRIETRGELELNKGRKIWLIISISLSFALLGFGIVIDYTYFFARTQGMFMMGVFAAMMSLLFGVLFLNRTFHVMSSIQQLFTDIKKKRIAIISTGIIGITISSISFVPLLGVPFYIYSAKKEFDEAFNPEFGGDWDAQIPEGQRRYLKKSHFEVLDYFVGPRYKDCIVSKDILYFNGSLSSYPVDESIILRFDAYLPPSGYINQPGENSTIIRIHGGGWVIGDKGTGNVGMLNRYLAHQGYCVFDIQYGLNNQSDLFSGIPKGFTPKEVMGNFTIDDILRHIGNFTYYLEDHASDFGANLDSVFVSGGSAGGQLTCATALSLASKNYTEFSSAYTIKGMIPFYPANNVSDRIDFAKTSRNEWVDPVQMLNATSPPCLIFQGKQDGLIIQSQILQDAYHGFGSTNCAHIQFPFAGHANDIYYTGFYNQIFLYYMERFLYLYH